MTISGTSSLPDQEIILTTSEKPEVGKTDLVDQKIQNVSQKALQPNSQVKTTPKKRKKIRRLILGMGQVVIGVVGVCVGGPLGMVAAGIGANGVVQIGIVVGDIMDCDDAQDRIDQIDRGHRDSNQPLEEGKGGNK